MTRFNKIVLIFLVIFIFSAWPVYCAPVTTGPKGDKGDKGETVVQIKINKDTQPKNIIEIRRLKKIKGNH